MNEEYTVANPPTRPGIYPHLPDAVYRKIPAVSQSLLKDFAPCPRKWKLAPPKKVTDAMRYGSLVDALWLSGDVSRYALQPTVYLSTGMECPVCKSVTDSKKCAKCRVERVEVQVETPWSNNSTTCRDWHAEREREGKEVVSREAWQMAHNACKRLNEVPEIRIHRERCDTQVAVVSTIDGILVKGLIDMLPHEKWRTTLGDLKCPPSADPEDWPKYVYNNRLHWQAYLYLTIWNQESGENVQWFEHFVSEQDPPHEPCYMPLSQDFIALGRRDVGRAIRQWAECQERAEYPGYEMNVETQPADWMLRE